MTTCPHCGCEFTPKQRSSPQHRRFFKLVSVAYQHWPERHYFKPSSSEHLRAWLICQKDCEYREISTVVLGREPTPYELSTIQGGIDAAGAYAWAFPYSDGYLVVRPKSMAFDKMPHKKACTVMAIIDELLCDVFQLRSTDELLQEHERAA